MDTSSALERGANILRVRFVGAAAFDADTTSGADPLAVQFTNTSSTLSLLMWQWEFGDGQISILRDPSHTYLTEGVYDVKLKAPSTNGVSIANKERFIVVGTPLPALFVVGNTTLGSGDAAVSNRLSSLGFAPVEVIHATDATSGDATGKTLVVISSSVGSGDVNTKFRGVHVPVLNWEEALYDDLGMSGSAGSEHGSITNQDDVLIVSNLHFLAAGYTGAVQVTESQSTFSWGIPSNEAALVGVVSTDTTRGLIFAYESNAVMPGLSAPARRVGFFLQDTTAAALNDKGWDLFDAAVNWAIGRTNDMDADGVIDFFDTDDDGDGMSDYYEDFYSLGRLDPSDAGVDNDGDGHSNYEESKANTDPGSSNSVLRLMPPIVVDSNTVHFSWPGRENVTYQLQSIEGLTSGTWQDVDSPITSYTNADITVTNTSNTNAAKAFRLELR